MTKSKQDDKFIFLKSAAVTIIGVFLLFVLLFLPLPGYIESPGEAEDLAKYVRIDHKKDTTKGSFDIVSVYLSRARLIDAIHAVFDPHADYESGSSVSGNENAKEFDRVQSFYLKSSVANAQQVAFKAAGHSAKLNYRGIYVMSIMDSSDFKKKLQIGDTITAINGKHFDNSAGFQNYLGKQKVHQKLKLTILRDGKTKYVTGRTMKLKNDQRYLVTNKVGVGITLVDDVEVITQPKTQVNVTDIGGPSGGLMFALQLYDQLTKGSLSRGRQIAGTGEIDAKGHVGEIGGIDKKVIAAKRAGAKVFLAPYVKSTKAVRALEPEGDTNYEIAKRTAKKYAPDMKVVPVKTFAEAKAYLKRSH